MASIAETLALVMRIDPAAQAVEHDELWWTWRDLDVRSAALQERFEQAGVGTGARVGILLRSRPAHVAALLSCVVGGRCAVAFNALLPPDRLAADLASQGVTMILGEKDDLARPEVEDWLRRAGVPAVAFDTAAGGAPIWVGDARQAPAATLEQRRPGILIEMLTSGTTGAPKRIPLGATNFEESLRGANAYERKRQGDDRPSLRSGVRIITAPLTHISGISGILLSLAGGRKICLIEKFAVSTWVGAVQRHKAKVVNAPPAALRMLLDADVPRESISSLIALRSGTAPLDPAIIDAFLERYNLPVLGQYGATEFAGSVAGWTIDDFRSHYASKRGSVGRFQPNIQGQIVDPETGALLTAGGEGVLELRGPQVAGGGEWVRTTDRAKIDEDGFLFILGRADSAINRGGFKIHPDEVVRALQEHAAIQEAVVVGITDRRLGEVPAAMATVRPGAEEPGIEELKRFLKERLLPYQVPVRIVFVADLPRTPLLKPSMPEVRRMIETEMAS